MRELEKFRVVRKIRLVENRLYITATIEEMQENKTQILYFFAEKSYYLAPGFNLKKKEH